ncbi:hydrolase 1, exosortase A system-associated [Stakelama marina]|uniref:Hydrolase 1, exosortase A system-associated n=1 Tax=Stakelama marina TaxID=2826939 RepID=A0A8T4IC34_9SPHN|nr:hydrolase 1, exosortase A system-associated [Stakelama marina]MBR0551941.1 hydrolase 1, exosortase A system-associated [Stakelama marina]
MRRLIDFDCEGETLIGSLDEADGETGLLIVSGGNEVRMGAHRGMAELARSIAGEGHPVFRFDPRGVGDSTGTNGGFRQRRDDIAAALSTFRKHVPHLRQIVAMGNCDAASALVLFQNGLGSDGLVLTNPWLEDAAGPDDALPAAAAIRARYAARLRDPRQWLRLARGGVNIGQLYNGLAKLVRSRLEQMPALVSEIEQAIANADCPITILLAERDNTAIAFADAWKTAPPAARSSVTLHCCDTGSHSFAHASDKLWLRDRVLEALRNAA